MAEQVTEVDLGGVTARFEWVAGAVLPAGVLLDHGDHEMLVAWADDEPCEFSLDSLTPLTVVEAATCTICGVSGRIEAGRWVPAGGGDAR